MMDGKLLQVDEQALMKEASEVGKRIFEKGKDSWEKADSKMVSYVSNGCM